MKVPFSYIVILFLSAVFLMSLMECNRRGSLADDNYAALTDTVKHYINRLGTETASKRTLLLDKKQLQDIIIKKDAELQKLTREFANVRSIVKTETFTRIDSVPVPYSIPAPCDFERTGAIKDKWYSFGYTSNQNGFKIDNLSIPNTLTVITGTKRKWFLGEETVTADITSDNPHVKVVGITAAEVAVPSPWYKKWYVWAAIGAAGGILIAK